MLDRATPRDPYAVRAPNGIRIRVSGLKGRYPGPLDDGGLPLAPSLRRGNQGSIQVPPLPLASSGALPDDRDESVGSILPLSSEEGHP